MIDRDTDVDVADTYSTAGILFGYILFKQHSFPLELDTRTLNGGHYYALGLESIIDTVWTQGLARKTYN
jgi:hypothetical protein